MTCGLQRIMYLLRYYNYNGVINYRVYILHKKAHEHLYMPNCSFTNTFGLENMSFEHRLFYDFCTIDDGMCVSYRIAIIWIL